MSDRKRYAAGTFHQVPDNLARAVSNTYEYVVLSYLIQCADNTGKCFPSYTALAQGIMSRYQAMRTMKALIEKGYVSISGRENQSNLYKVNLEKLVNDIDQSTTLTSQRDRPHWSTTLTPLVNDVDPEPYPSNHTQEPNPRATATAREDVDEKKTLEGEPGLDNPEGEGRSDAVQEEPGSDNSEQEFAAILACYTENIGPAGPLISEKLRATASRYTLGQFEYAVGEAVEANVLRWSYVSNVLEGKGHGVKSRRGDAPGGNGNGRQTGKYTGMVKR